MDWIEIARALLETCDFRLTFTEHHGVHTIACVTHPWSEVIIRKAMVVSPSFEKEHIERTLEMILTEIQSDLRAYANYDPG